MSETKDGEAARLSAGAFDTGLFGKHRFHVGQRVRPSQEGIDGLFRGTYRGEKKAEWSGVVLKVDRFNSPTVQWDALKRPISYWGGFIAPDRRRPARERTR